ncbi:MAG: hypothetical protein JW832_04515 [Deltaproteobacteria bacterium]|nr:hypothetical protein [Deltaproteobacteria bacterium]
MDPFKIFDCTLLSKMSGLRPAVNLRELRDRVALCSSNVLYHHFCETPLVPLFDYPDYRNDFAIWARHHLRDEILAERLGIIDPYAHACLEDLRAAVLEIIDDHLSERTMVPWAPPGRELYFMESITVVFDTGERIDHPDGLAAAIDKMTHGSIYFHFLEARRRPPLGLDDFTAWLETLSGDQRSHITAIASIDFPFYTLAEIKKTLVSVLSNKEPFA